MVSREAEMICNMPNILDFEPAFKEPDISQMPPIVRKVFQKFGYETRDVEKYRAMFYVACVLERKWRAIKRATH